MQNLYELFNGSTNCYLQKYDKNSSFFAFAIILAKNNRNKILNKLKNVGIETRPIVSGIS